MFPVCIYSYGHILLCHLKTKSFHQQTLESLFNTLLAFNLFGLQNEVTNLYPRCWWFSKHSKPSLLFLFFADARCSVLQTRDTDAEEVTRRGATHPMMFLKNTVTSSRACMFWLQLPTLWCYNIVHFGFWNVSVNQSVKMSHTLFIRPC